jgi:endonuclease/exonuclease/phosphatase family metal-dependent hydrolase
MRLITWNVQWCRGVDGRVDPARIADTARAFSDFDVLCLQEVTVNFPGLPGNQGEDQIAELASALPGYTALFGAATDLGDASAGRRQFGNAIFTRLPVLQVFRHLLPWPPDPAVPSMQRMALEAVLECKSGPLRVICTHLEYYSTHQRLAQIDALRRLHHEACMHAAHPRPAGDAGGPFEAMARPGAAVLCGDFNFRPGSAEHAAMSARFEDGTTPALLDAWSMAHPGQSHELTVGLYDAAWPEAYCCDFVFVSADLSGRVERVEVEARTQASDHQPLLVTLRD